jgi:branched-chain amino acid transport system permease protein
MKLKLRSWIKFIIIVVVLFILPAFFPNAYIAQIANLAGIYVILAMGLNVLTGFTGQLSLGIAAFFGMGAYTSALLDVNFKIPFLSCMLAAIVVTMVSGLILGFPALKVKGSYLVLLTIGFGEIIRLLMVNWLSLTRGPSGIVGIRAPVIFGIQFDTLTKNYYLIGVIALLAFLYIRLLIHSRAGRSFLAIREDDGAAELCGINITEYKLKAFAISAGLCGVAGSLYAHMIRYISPDSFTGTQSQLFLCMIIIGGMGTLSGPIIGAILLTILPEILRFLNTGRMVLYGILIILVVIRWPGGISKYAAVLLAFLKRKVTKAQTDEKKAGSI